MMDSLIITDHDSEYYLSDQKLYFLENIKRINLFIGANNTRKSRFLRKIIEGESRVVVSSDNDINKNFIEGRTLAKQVEDQFKDKLNAELMVVTTTRHPPQTDKRFFEIDAYFETGRASNDKGVNFKVIVDHLNNINETLLGIRGGDNIAPLLKNVKMVYALVDMLVYLYGLRENMAALSNFLSNSNTWPEDNLNAYAFTFADGRIDGNTDDKENILKKIKTYLAFLLTVDVTVGTNYLRYIPVLRTARSLSIKGNAFTGPDIFHSTIHDQYFKNKLPNEGEAIFTGQSFYDDVHKQKSGLTAAQVNFKKFEEFIGESFFQSKDLTITAYHNTSGGKKEVMVSLPGERHDIPIQDLGDGVQAVINLLFPVFTAKDNSWIFIDEPELNLHPGYQNLLIRTLLENEFLKDKNLRYFINTHSNHILSELLINDADDSEIYVFSKRDKDSSRITAFKGYEAATLELLGVLNTSTLLSNCSIWVEGVTDRLYLRAFLDAYLKDSKQSNPIEGLNYTFIEYGGNNLVHYLFEDTTSPVKMDEGIRSFFINNKIFLLADTDKNKDKKHQFYKKLERKNFQYFETKYPEIENVIPAKVLNSFLKDRLKIDAIIADAITRYSYKSVKLGKFLSKQFKKHQIKKSVAPKTGSTLKADYKMMLALYVVGGVQKGEITWADLKPSEVIVDVISKMCQFIESSNK